MEFREIHNPHVRLLGRLHVTLHLLIRPSRSTVSCSRFLGTESIEFAPASISSKYLPLISRILNFAGGISLARISSISG
jgi:hypothetical protein